MGFSVSLAMESQLMTFGCSTNGILTLSPKWVTLPVLDEVEGVMGVRSLFVLCTLLEFMSLLTICQLDQISLNAFDSITYDTSCISHETPTFLHIIRIYDPFARSRWCCYYPIHHSVDGCLSC